MLQEDLNGFLASELLRLRSGRASDEVARSRPSSRAILLKSDERFFWKSIIGWMRYFSSVGSQCTFRTCFLFWSHDRTNSCPVDNEKENIFCIKLRSRRLLFYESEKKDKSLALCNTKQCLPNKKSTNIFTTFRFLTCALYSKWLFSHKKQNPCALLDVTCYVRLHSLLHVVGSCCAKFETSQTFKSPTPNLSFVLWSPKRLAQQCWIRLHSSSMLGIRTRITHSLQSLMGCIRQVPTLLGVVAPVCTPLPTWTQKLPKLKTGFS